MEEETNEMALVKQGWQTKFIRAISWPFKMDLKGALIWLAIAGTLLICLGVFLGPVWLWPLPLAIAGGIGFSLTIVVAVVSSINHVERERGLREPKILQEGKNPQTPNPEDSVPPDGP